MAPSWWSKPPKGTTVVNERELADLMSEASRLRIRNRDLENWNAGIAKDNYRLCHEIAKIGERLGRARVKIRTMHRALHQSKASIDPQEPQ